MWASEIKPDKDNIQIVTRGIIFECRIVCRTPKGSAVATARRMMTVK